MILAGNKSIMSKNNGIKPIALLSLLLLTLIWGYSWIVMKSVLNYIDALDFTALRTCIASLLLLFLLKLTGRSIKPPLFLPTMLIGLFQTVGMSLFSQLALMHGGAGKVAIMVYTMPFWLICFSAWLLKERLNATQFFSMSIAIIGLTLILRPWLLTQSTYSYLLAILSGLCWAISAMLAKKLYKRYEVDALTLTTWQMLYGAPVLLIITLLFNNNHYLITAPYLWFALSYNVILATAIAWLLWLYILKNMPANIAGLSTLAIPVSGVLLSWWLLNEQPNTIELSGICLIIFALACLNLKLFNHKSD